MGYVVRIEPSGNEENEYATPCFFNFDDMSETLVFLRYVLEHGNEVDVYLSKLIC